MLCDRVLGNVTAPADLAPRAGKLRDVFDVTWRDCARRAVRGRSRNGVAVGVLLPLGTTLRHGDILFEDADRLVVVNLQPCEVWVADFADAASMAGAALELGNLHLPVEVAGAACLVTPPDGPARGVFDRYAASWRPDVRQFQPLRATVLSAADLRLASGFRVQLTNSRE